MEETPTQEEGKEVPTFEPGTMAALHIVEGWDGQGGHNYILAEWQECDGEMQWCRWPLGGRVLDYQLDKILRIWVLGNENAISCRE